MKNLFKYLALFIIAVTVVSCNNDDENNNSQNTALIKTLQPETGEITNTYLFKGVVDREGKDLYTVGFCWSEMPSPTIQNDTVSMPYNRLGEYSIQISNLKPNTKYYIRAFAQSYNNVVEVQYGNEIEYTTTELNDFFVKATDISITTAKLNFTYDAVVYSTSPNPTINNIIYFREESNLYPLTRIGLGNLEPNTLYYARAIHFINDNPVYSNEIQFRTTGYEGPGGGIVVIDRGENAQDYRYVEIYTTSLTFDPALGTGAKWGNVPSIAALGLRVEAGYGMANTASIVNANTDPDCAAKLCADFTNNGKDDWFLGSFYDMAVVLDGLKNAGMIITDRAWTSHAYNDGVGNSIKLVSGAYINDNYPLDATTKVFPLRSYN